MELLAELNREGMTIVMVTHNPERARRAGRTLTVSDGLLVEESHGFGNPESGWLEQAGAAWCAGLCDLFRHSGERRSPGGSGFRRNDGRE